MAIEITSGDIFTAEQLTKHAKIYAGPGAGKTHFLVQNVKNIITTNPLITDSRSRKVLCITYTNAAVGEINHRLERFTDYVEAHTIHGFIIEHIIRPFQQDLRALMKSDFGIAVNGKGRISSQVEGLGILHGIDRNEIYEYIRRTNPSEFGQEVFEYSKKTMSETEVNDELFVSSGTSDAPREMKLKASGKIDSRHIVPLKQYIWSVVKRLTHNEILYFGYRILETNPTALYAMRVKFPFIFVDEFQDTSPLQTMLIKLIGGKSSVIGIVGDVAQSIYSFQGARPADFGEFSIPGNRELVEYSISGNRRSTVNIVSFCNFLRQSDNTVVQNSIRLYPDEESKSLCESKKVHFLIGDSPVVQELLHEIIEDGGVVLTRAWAAAFSYIRGVSEEQVKLLRKIYNSYYNSPIQLRDEIAEHNNVTWVRAFRFIFSLWESYQTGSFIDVIKALKLYININIDKITPKILFLTRELVESIFSDISDQHMATAIILSFNSALKKEQFGILTQVLFEPDFQIPLFDELDNEKLVSAVNSLTWDTSYKLFNDVFSEGSKYMTVHQAKGLEWGKVIVSVTPNKFDGTSLASLYSAPILTGENPSDEFARMYYVACSRAKEDLYIHISSGCNSNTIETAISAYTKKTGEKMDYEIIV